MIYNLINTQINYVNKYFMSNMFINSNNNTT